MKFKNLRRPSRAKFVGITLDSEPSEKKMKLDEDDLPEDKIAYERHTEYLQQLYASKKWSVGSVMVVLEQTSIQRRKWITEECPSLLEIMKSFPCFNDPKIVSI